MALTELTKITSPGIKTDTNWVGNNANFTGVTTTASSFNVGVTTIHSTLTESHNVVSTGVITATKFVGDGSDLTGVSGFSTAMSNDTSSLLNHIFKTNNTYNIGAGTSVTIQSDVGSGNIAFTRLHHINVGTGATLHIGAGTTFLMNVLNIF